MLKNLWRYIVKTAEFILIIEGFEYILEDLSLYIYRDVSFADDLMTYISIGNHVVFLAGCLITWKLKKQTIIILSTIKVEFINFTFTIKSVQ